MVVSAVIPLALGVASKSSMKGAVIGGMEKFCQVLELAASIGSDCVPAGGNVFPPRVHAAVNTAPANKGSDRSGKRIGDLRS